MKHVSSVRPTVKFSEKVENLKRWARLPGWNVPNGISRSIYTFLVVYTSSRSTGKKSVTASSQNKMASLGPSLMNQCTVCFFAVPSKRPEAAGKTLQRSSSSTKHSARKPLLKTTNSCPVPGFGICLVHG